MPFQTIDSQRLYQMVADQIGELIRSGEFPPGHRLPPERDLSKKLGVSRPVVREAMIALEIAGLIEVRTGSGTYVRDQLTTPQPGIDVGHSPSDILTSRMMIEGDIAALAATTISDRALADLDALVDLLNHPQDAGPGIDADLQFHVGIAAATGNGVLPALVEWLWQMQHAPVFSILSERVRLRENREATVRAHRDIVKALRARDPVAASQSMRAHLNQVLELLSGEQLVA